jgi:hypothetical protein
MRTIIAAFFLLVMTAGSAAAQGNPQTREGFWISFGFGYGSLGCDDCEDEEDEDRLSGGSGYLRMGGTLSQRLLIGGEINVWGKEEGNVSFTVSNITPVLIFYPSADGGLFLKGGLGLANADVELGPLSGNESGVGLTLGAGYDARVGRNFALTPYFDIAVSSFDGISFNRYSFGLGFTWP